ncbi:MAG: hypothetical protein ACD_73C00067G0003, partial [uncultured bacterium]
RAGVARTPKIEWTNFIFIVSTPLIALFGMISIYSTQDVSLYTWILFAFMMMATGLGITAGYHRFFSHKSYKTHWLVELLLILFGGASFEGSVREWCSAHRKHHRYVDNERDPYNINKGFWYAHVGWVVLKSDQTDESDIKDLLKDKLVLFQDRHYVILATLVSFILPAALASLWGNFWAGLVIAGFLRLVLNHHFTFFINSYCHFFGKQPYSSKNTARDSWLISFFTYGEGYHNFHHAFEYDYRNGIRFFDWDPTKWLIVFLSKIKLATNLKTVSWKRILEARLLMKENELSQKINKQSHIHLEYLQAIQKTRNHLLQLSQKIEDLKAEYLRIRKDKVAQFGQNMDALKYEMDLLKKEFQKSYQNWKVLICQPTFQLA